MKPGLSVTAKIMCSVLAGLCAFFMAVGLIVNKFVISFEAPAAYAAGLLIGTALSMVRVIMMERSLNRAADMEDYDHARSYGSMQVFIRNLVTVGVFLLVFFYRTVFGLFGTIIGALSIQLAAYITGFFLRKDSAQI